MPHSGKLDLELRVGNQEHVHNIAVLKIAGDLRMGAGGGSSEKSMSGSVCCTQEWDPLSPDPVRCKTQHASPHLGALLYVLDAILAEGQCAALVSTTLG
jgi:hypothetical protein